jgi:glycosyltransferase involved in cell wall biosynthesis
LAPSENKAANVSAKSPDASRLETPTPSISVIVTAHGRREFLLGAVRSAVDQTLARSEYEIWVVKDFSDPEIDAALDGQQVHHVVTNEVSLGSKLAIGLQRSRGGIATFLEDDDGYTSDRLAVVLARFRADSDLGFYRNGQLLVGGKGVVLPERAYGPPHVRLRRLGEVTATPGGLDRAVHSLARIDPDFNLSSIAIQRRILRSGPEELRNRRAAVDSYLFYRALNARATVTVDSRPLTVYRVHPTNVSLIREATPEAIARWAKYQRDFLEAFQPIFEECVRDGPRGAVQLSGGAYFGTRVVFEVLTGEGGRAAVWKDLRSFWHWAPLAKLRSRWDITCWGLGATIVPGFTRRAYLRRRVREATRTGAPG